MSKTFTAPYSALDYADGPLVWIDCEMTGLNPRTNKILEIAVRAPTTLTVARLFLFTSIEF